MVKELDELEIHRTCLFEGVKNNKIQLFHLFLLLAHIGTVIWKIFTREQ